MRSPRLTNRVTPAGVQINPAKPEAAIAEGHRLTERDHLVISLLAEHKVMTAEQLARVAFPNANRARHRLLLLTERGVLARFRHLPPAARHWHYTLGLLGATVHAAATGAPLPRPAEITNRILRLHYSPSLGHLVGVNDFFTRLIAEARTTGRGELSVWWAESRAAQACGGIVRPDGYGEWAEAGAAVGFMFEHDTGSETLSALVGKVERYAELAGRGITRPVLFELPASGRETYLHRALIRRYGPAGPPVTVATTTAPGAARPAVSPAGPVWLPATRSATRRRLTDLGGIAEHLPGW